MIRWQGITIDRQERELVHERRILCLSPYQFRLTEALLIGGPLSKEALFGLLYEDREDGGPDGGLKMVWVMMTQLKRKLARIGLEIVASGPYGARLYCAVPKRKAGDAIERNERWEHGGIHNAPIDTPGLSLGLNVNALKQRERPLC